MRFGCFKGVAIHLKRICREVVQILQHYRVESMTCACAHSFYKVALKIVTVKVSADSPYMCNDKACFRASVVMYHNKIYAHEAVIPYAFVLWGSHRHAAT